MTRIVEVAVNSGTRFPVRRFPSRSEIWCPSESWNHAPMCSITHVPTGMRLGDLLDLRVAQILAAIFDRIFPGRTAEECERQSFDLPPDVRLWVMRWKKGNWE